VLDASKLRSVDLILSPLLSFQDKYPDYKSKVVLSVKGGMDIENIKAKGMGGMMPDASIENLRLDLERARETLNTKNGGKEIDVYEMARIDVKVSQLNVQSFSQGTLS